MSTAPEMKVRKILDTTKTVDSIPVEIGKLADRNGVQVKTKMHDQVPELPLRNPGTQDVLVLWLLHWAQGTSLVPQLGKPLPHCAWFREGGKVTITVHIFVTLT